MKINSRINSIKKSLLHLVSILDKVKDVGDIDKNDRVNFIDTVRVLNNDLQLTLLFKIKDKTNTFTKIDTQYLLEVKNWVSIFLQKNDKNYYPLEKHYYNFLSNAKLLESNISKRSFSKILKYLMETSNYKIFFRKKRHGANVIEVCISN